MTLFPFPLMSLSRGQGHGSAPKFCNYTDALWLAAPALARRSLTVLAIALIPGCRCDGRDNLHTAWQEDP
jgi:hypothetical protein